MKENKIKVWKDRVAEAEKKLQKFLVDKENHTVAAVEALHNVGMDISREELETMKKSKLLNLKNKFDRWNTEDERDAFHAMCDYYFDVAYKRQETLERELEKAKAKLAELEGEQQKSMDSVPDVKIVWDVLDAWGEQLTGWLIGLWNRLADEGIDELHNEVYPDIQKHYEELIASGKNSNSARWNNEAYKKERMEEWEKEYNVNVIRNFGGFGYSEDTTELTAEQEERFLREVSSYIEEEKKRKYIELIQQVTNIVGNITDTRGLRVGQTGNLEGFIIGDEGTAEVWSTLSGGYNIQALHFRFYVKPRNGIDIRHTLRS